MPTIELRPGLAMAYEDHWFGAPWTTPETIVMIHGNSESSRAWTQWVPHLAGKYRVRAARPARLRRVVGAEGLRLHAPRSSPPISGASSTRSASRAAT